MTDTPVAAAPVDIDESKVREILPPPPEPGLPAAERQLLDILDWADGGGDPTADNAPHYQQIKHLADVIGLLETAEQGNEPEPSGLSVSLSAAGRFEQTRLSAKEVRLLAQAAADEASDDE